jgi:hypothetical protein
LSSIKEKEDHPKCKLAKGSVLPRRHYEEKPSNGIPKNSSVSDDEELENQWDLEITSLDLEEKWPEIQEKS